MSREFSGNKSKLLIHVGYPKTGSTWLQQYVFNNGKSEFLAAWGLQSSIAYHQFIPVSSLPFCAERVRRVFESGLQEALEKNLIPVLSQEMLVGAQARGDYWGSKKRYNYDYSLQDFFDELVKNQKMESEISEFQRYQVNNVVAVDFIGRYEKLRDDLTLVCTQLGIPFDGWLPNAKGGFRTDRKSYKEILNDEHKERVQRLCPEVIHLMGYSFEHPEQAKPYQRQQLDEA